MLGPIAPAAAQSGWTGGYAGARIGYGYQRDDSNETIQFDRDLNGGFGDTITTVTGRDAFSRGFCGGALSADQSSCRDENGANVAAFAGYDMDMGGLVAGGVVEFGRSKIEDSVTAFSITPAFYTITRRLRSVASVRARVGYPLFTNTLPYVTGGVAAGEVRYSFATDNRVNTVQLSDRRDLKFGYQVGGGVEQRIAPSFSLGAQYLFLNLGAEDFRARLGGANVPVSNPFIQGNRSGTDFRRSDRRFKTHDISFVASYRF
ncbi:MAG TPA: outer membrane beta-barrel protein [Sphingomicrobium sp.]|nr:outer membrane beta-barrel protein [Sphingomicrobium sp.]